MHPKVKHFGELANSKEKPTFAKSYFKTKELLPKLQKNLVGIRKQLFNTNRNKHQKTKIQLYNSPIKQLNNNK